MIRIFSSSSSLYQLLRNLDGVIVSPNLCFGLLGSIGFESHMFGASFKLACVVTRHGPYIL